MPKRSVPRLMIVSSLVGMGVTVKNFQMEAVALIWLRLSFTDELQTMMMMLMSMMGTNSDLEKLNVMYLADNMLQCITGLAISDSES
mmetsp:Transcript_26759/g.32442  ORF Transcript_26759/g.32442 Transcript_26759/m.32442 type:complete len:87 (-) Transcript_26759:160-420(-)